MSRYSISSYIVPIMWAWMIIVGGFLIVPGREPICIVCTPLLIKLIGVISIVIGLVAAFTTRAVANR